MADDRHSWEVRVSGCVQGVFYRAHTREAATRLGVVGWVRNEPDGTVHALIQHRNPLVLTDLVSIMRQGPPGAMVAECDVTPVQGTVQYERFEILR